MKVRRSWALATGAAFLITILVMRQLWQPAGSWAGGAESSISGERHDASRQQTNNPTPQQSTAAVAANASNTTERSPEQKNPTARQQPTQIPSPPTRTRQSQTQQPPRPRPPATVAAPLPPSPPSPPSPPALPEAEVEEDGEDVNGGEERVVEAEEESERERAEQQQLRREQQEEAQRDERDEAEEREDSSNNSKNKNNNNGELASIPETTSPAPAATATLQGADADHMALQRQVQDLQQQLILLRDKHSAYAPSKPPPPPPPPPLSVLAPSARARAQVKLQGLRLGSTTKPVPTCAAFLEGRRRFANFSAAVNRVEQAWGVHQRVQAARATASREYCLVRCALLKCCPQGTDRGGARIHTIKDSITVGAPLLPDAAAAAGDDHDAEERPERSAENTHGPARPLKSAPTNNTHDLDITLVTHGTVDRLATFNMINAVWPGPKVVVFLVFASPQNTSTPSADKGRAPKGAGNQSAVDRDVQAIAAASAGWTNVRVIVCVVKAVQDFFTSRLGASGPQIPINTLRNIGVDNAPTNYVFPLDMDFIPSRRLYTKLRRTYLPLLSQVDRVAVVLPHWETLKCAQPTLSRGEREGAGGRGGVSRSGSKGVNKGAGVVGMHDHEHDHEHEHEHEQRDTPPLTFRELDAQVRAGRARPFHVRTDMVIPQTIVDVGMEEEEVELPAGCERGTDEWLAGVQASNYPRWYREGLHGRDGIVPLHVQMRPQMLRNYEPFVIVRRVEASGLVLPRYQEEFVGRYKNKVAWVTALRAHRYQFHLLLGEFVVHVPHAVKDQTTPPMQRHFRAMERLFWREQAQLTRTVLSPTGARYPGIPKASPMPRGFVCTEA